jgi:hypothetical protein
LQESNAICPSLAQTHHQPEVGQRLYIVRRRAADPEGNLVRECKGSRIGRQSFFSGSWSRSP